MICPIRCGTFTVFNYSYCALPYQNWLLFQLAFPPLIPPQILVVLSSKLYNLIRVSNNSNLRLLRRGITILLLMLLPAWITAQTVTGTVFDENKQPLPGASVYLDGTSTGTVTAEDGTFRLEIEKRINTVLVFSFIGYQTEMVAGPFENRRYQVHLKPRTDVLKEVVISKGGFTRKQMMSIFLEEFLGRSHSGKSCRIVNPDEINLRYDYQKNCVIANSDVPLIIENPHLGYEIDFNLIECQIAFSSKSVSRRDVLSNAFSGTTVFKEMPDPDNVFEKRRQQVFHGSQTEFFRNLINGVWGKEQFQLFKGSHQTAAEEWFSVDYDNGYYVVKVHNTEMAVKRQTLEPKIFYAPFNLLYSKKRQSGVIFKTQTFKVDSFGNTNAPMDIVFTGEIARLRAGDLLPIDYTP